MLMKPASIQAQQTGRSPICANHARGSSGEVDHSTTGVHVIWELSSLNHHKILLVGIWSLRIALIGQAINSTAQLWGMTCTYFFKYLWVARYRHDWSSRNSTSRSIKRQKVTPVFCAEFLDEQQSSTYLARRCGFFCTVLGQWLDIPSKRWSRGGEGRSSQHNS